MQGVTSKNETKRLVYAKLAVANRNENATHTAARALSTRSGGMKERGP